MQVRLMFRDKLYTPAENPRFGADDVLTDLQLEDVLLTMAGGDRLVYQVAQDVLTHPLTDHDTITYRQQVLQDCLERPEATAELYGLCTKALKTERSVYIGFVRENPSAILSRARTVLNQLVPHLRTLATFAGQEVSQVRSTGLTSLYSGLVQDLDDQFFEDCQAHLRRLAFSDGVIIGRRLGPGNEGVEDLLHPPEKAPLVERMGLPTRTALTYQIPARDEAGGAELSAIQGRGLNQIANATAQAADFLRYFFEALQREIGFYLGAVRLHRQLTGSGQPTCMPALLDEDDDLVRGSELYDPHLPLVGERSVIRNDVPAGARTGIVITGANSGGKSTLLRAIGSAQLMAQAGMFVPARSWSVRTTSRVFTHFAREEDSGMVGGRFFDELKRLSEIIEHTKPGSWILMNETFAGTNEAEAANLGDDLIGALRDSGVPVVLVTHNFDLAGRLVEADPGLLSLRAERLESGQRTFRLLPADPLPTAFGRDIYQRLAPWPYDPAPAADAR
ncbi:DNA mismatch repair protein MutS [Microlunatus endophyticus]|uniref:DNA mismatch repair protein MutS n=1 Tax=Microlunatus endophyticus TaxID=1716077 RepID=A0A917SIA6_9ACTN|nr:DNA mismatch repair protein MutS [Microlunatus endophyticus]GGL79277.1 DNA mismatch repair protein MutS [Microlunatus endophyticus]